ncbi:MAG: hypothetical protein WCK05_12545 [Planctomycetota bacterium]
MRLGPESHPVKTARQAGGLLMDRWRYAVELDGKANAMTLKEFPLLAAACSPATS